MRHHGSLLDELKKHPLLCDGAMGTQLMAAGLKSGACGELWNVERPHDVEAIHKRYIDAGCDLITTNTFGGTVAALAKHHLQQRVEEFNRAGAAVAHKAANKRAFVLGDIGPCGGFLEPVGEITREQALDMFLHQAGALRDGGANAIIVETMVDPEELSVAVEAAKRLADWPVIATYAFERGDGITVRTMMGTAADRAMKVAIDAGADVVGANCGTSLGFEDYIRLAEAMVHAAGATPVIVQPNAGAPQTIGDKLVYRCTPEQMGVVASDLLKAGVRVIGGCCGTTPEHLKAMGQVVHARRRV